MTDQKSSHLIEDLLPYACTYANCIEGDKNLLNTWEEWLIHERVYHRMRYICLEHAATPFSTEKEYVDHVEHYHISHKKVLLLPEEIARHGHIPKVPDRPCPLCSYATRDWSDMDKHMASHLEEISLLALPTTTGFEEGIEGDLVAILFEYGERTKKCPQSG